MRMTIDKLEGIRNDLVRTDDDWQEWKYPELIEALRKWTVRKPVKSEDNHPDKHNKSKNFQTSQESKPRVCVYCDDANHRSAECKKVVTVADRRKILGDKQLCKTDTTRPFVTRKWMTKAKVPKSLSKCWLRRERTR